MARFRETLRVCISLTIVAALLAGPAHAQVATGDSNSQKGNSTCQLAPGVRRVIELQFDNVHLRRDNPNVPSDLQQMPNLLNFLRSQGTLLTNHHTPLISHTADDIITTLTGNYGDKHGQPVANSYGFFRADGSVGFSSSFAYWTDTAPDGAPQMIDSRGKVHPAPWAPFTRAGCDVGAFSMANIEFENISSDINNVFGANSSEAAEAKANPAKAVADFEGIAIHCARDSRVCGAAGAPDLLPDEPGGYAGFAALYGNVNVAPRINHGQNSVNDLDGNVIADSNGNPGFPGFDPSASQSLGYAAQMLEAGVPVVYLYIADAHDNHFTFSGSYGPGEVGYVEQLAAYNSAFGKFFARLKADGITPDNTLFIVTADENDHFAGQAGAPAGCDGVHTPCTYIRLPVGCDGDFIPCATTNLGEVDVDMRQLLLTELNDATPLSVHSDDAPTVYVSGNPGPNDPLTRNLERNLAKLVAFDPITNSTPVLMKRMADPTEMSFLHMVTQDPARTPTLAFFGNDDFFITAGSNVATCTPLASCSDEQPGFNWNHGDFQRSITHTWLGIVGPHVRREGATDEIFTDHTDVRPTLMHLTGLRDDYAHDGRVVVEVLDDEITQRETLSRLAAAYKAINAPIGELGRRTLMLSTRALAGDDATYNALEEQIRSVTAQRNAIADRMIAILEATAFNGAHVNEEEARDLIDAADRLIDSVR
jgi:arylsulfatase A-like enzyme